MLAICQRCQKPITVTQANLPVQCPHCLSVGVPLADPMGRPPETTSAPKGRPRLPRRTPAKYAQVGTATCVLAVLFFMCMLGSLVATLRQRDSYAPGSLYDRFQSDNAVGATANAVEHLATTGPMFFGPDTFLLAGLICVLIWNVQRLRVDLAMRADD